MESNNSITLKCESSIILILISCILSLNCSIKSNIKHQSSYPSIYIIPQPMEVVKKSGFFTFVENTTLYVREGQPEAHKAASLLIEMFAQQGGYDWKIQTNQKTATVHIILDDRLNDLGPEGYLLDIDEHFLRLQALSYGGLINGIQTIRQLLPVEIENTNLVKNVAWIVPCVHIKDKPRFAWRGYMKDVSRTFYPPSVIKNYLDAMALYKLNVFHFHLTDDQGWRIEIKKYPELTSKQSTVFHERYNEPAERSGFYTQNQLRDLVTYAAKRNITIVPEIDLPGHCWPALLAYPELSVNQDTNPPHVFPFLASWTHWPNQRTPNTFDPTNEHIYAFLEDIFDEVIDIFPSDYIHFGGDEVQFSVWEDAPHIRQFIRHNGLKDNLGLQGYFVARVCDIIKSKGRKPIGWNDILAGDPDQIRGTAIMSWLGEGSIKEATSQSFLTVATPTEYTYFDITQADRNDGTMSDLAYPVINSLERVYGYEPTKGLESDMEKYVLGIQANMWTAIPQEVKDMNVQNFPRLLAVAEISWIGKEDREYSDFLKRLESQYPRLDELKIDYYRQGGYIAGIWSPDTLETDFNYVEWNVTNKVYTNGRIMAGFYFTEGEHFLEISKVELLEDSNVISSDEHEGLADRFRGTHKTKTYQYHLKVDQYHKNAAYHVRALIKGRHGTDSYGNFTFNLSPYQPFSVIEPRH